MSKIYFSLFIGNILYFFQMPWYKHMLNSFLNWFLPCIFLNFIRMLAGKCILVMKYFWMHKYCYNNLTEYCISYWLVKISFMMCFELFKQQIPCKLTWDMLEHILENEISFYMQWNSFYKQLCIWLFKTSWHNQEQSVVIGKYNR